MGVRGPGLAVACAGPGATRAPDALPELRERPDPGPVLNRQTGQVRIQEGKGSKPRVVLVGKRAKEALWRWMMVRPENALSPILVTEEGIA